MLPPKISMKPMDGVFTNVMPGIIPRSMGKSRKLHDESEMFLVLIIKMRSIKGLYSHSSSMKQVNEGWVPDFKNHHFTTDFRSTLHL